ncbi:MAG: hypothetical protein JNL74_13845 [Fibrobacteres bacterium]|nr:hypothetical protein [Fibrobacterota bacterium]
MFKLLTVAIVSLLFTNCSHSISRYGYEKKEGTVNCNPILKYGKNLGNLPVFKVGGIRLSDTGFSLTCNKYDALAILQKEACSIGADIIIILEVDKPDFFSTCYRVEADFVKLKDSRLKDKLTSDELD